ncbi:MAG: general secretion pathway protein GspK [Proteobacteria bacterium]|nr:MAG: general secretion pathway protein GspK [Pseudomonadota bacterium]
MRRTERKQRPRPWRQDGVALLSVMFILVLLTTMAVYMVEGDHMMLSRASNQRTLEQGIQLAVGSERWAMRVLQRDLVDGDTDHLGEDWNRLGTPVEVDDGNLRTTAMDLQGRFNLNNLNRRGDDVWYAAFKRLLRLLEIDEGVAEAVVDWIDSDEQRTHSDGAEDLEYLLFDPPYRAANRPMADLGEMLLVSGVDEEILSRLAPFVTVIPDARGTRINVNTCPTLLFQIFGDEMTAADAEALAAMRAEQGFESVEAFLASNPLAGEPQQVAEPLVTLSSDYFLVTSEVKIGDMNLATDSTIKRDSARRTVSVVSRAWGFL